MTSNDTGFDEMANHSKVENKSWFERTGDDTLSNGGLPLQDAIIQLALESICRGGTTAVQKTEPKQNMFTVSVKEAHQDNNG